ncbi:hypothetical protein [Nocardia brasiliensis]|uniref:hypothetical protein n=1 Tax=Nocardia brasiliensis TaxID=37326 RepID=UPI0004A6ADDA|nr:hypothetical protein [Nocardia brasiliensis]
MPLTNFGKPQPGWVRTTDLEQTQQPRPRPIPTPPAAPPPSPALARKPGAHEPDSDALPTGCALAALIGTVALLALIIVLLAHYLG